MGDVKLKVLKDTFPRRLLKRDPYRCGCKAGFDERRIATSRPLEKAKKNAGDDDEDSEWQKNVKM